MMSKPEVHSVQTRTQLRSNWLKNKKSKIKNFHNKTNNSNKKEQTD